MCYCCEQAQSEEPIESPEEQWEQGYHTTKDGQEIGLRDMKDSHIRNCIRFFGNKGFDTILLEKELKDR